MDVQYIVDTSAELGEITPLETAALYLISPAYHRVDKLIADDLAMPQDFLQNTAREALRASTIDERHWVALNSLRSVHSLSRCIRERAEYILQKKIQSDLNVSTPFRLIDGLAEDGVSFRAQKMVETEADVTETVVRAILNQQMGGFLQRLKSDSDGVDEAILWYRRDGGKLFRQLQLSHTATMDNRESLSGDSYTAAVKAQKARKRILNKRPVRGAIKKICKLFAQFKQEDNLRLFVSGHEVEMSHPDSKLKFILRPLGEPGWLEDRSAKGHAHTPYDLSVLTKENVFIAKLCVYFSDTPVLDQLLALSLFVQAGDELKVLEKANFFAFVEGGGDTAKAELIAAYPSLEGKFPTKRSATDDHDVGLVVVPGATRKVVQLPLEYRIERDHWEPFKGRMEAWVNTWFEPVLSQLLPKADMMRIAP